MLARLALGFLLLGVPVRATASTCVWDGGGANNNFTTASNWAGNTVSPFNYAPADTADALVFSGSTRLTPNNDTPSGETNGQTAFTLSFATGAGAFVVGGNKITLGSTTGSGGSGGSISNLSAQTQTLNCEVAPRAGTILAQGGPLVFNGRFNIGNGATNRTNTVDGPFDITLNGRATSKGVLLKRGSGRLLLLNASNDFTGPMLIAGGTVSLGAGGAVTNSTFVYVTGSGMLELSQLTAGFELMTNQTLAGDGTVTGAVQVASGALLAPGPTNSIGALALKGPLTLHGDLRVRWRKSGGNLTNDLVQGVTDLVCGGGLVLTNTGTVPLAAGDTLKLFAATTCSGIFETITPPVPCLGLVWDLGGLSTSGTLKVVSAPTVSQVTVAGDRTATLTVSGPAGQLCQIYASTNVALPFAQWSVLTGGVVTLNPSAVRDTAASNMPQRFYRTSTSAYNKVDGLVQVAAATSPTGTWRDYPTRVLDCLPTLLQVSSDSGFSAFGGLLARQTNAAGYFRTCKIGERWWLVDPTGYLFLHRGVAVISTLSATGAVAALQAKFGTTANWATATTALLRQYAFNGAGAWSDTTRLRVVNPPLVYTRIWSFLDTYSKTNTGPGYPYVFDSAFETFCDSYARQLGGQKTDPWLLGHFSDNELPFPTTILTNFLSLPAGNASADAAWAWLRNRYGTNAALSDVTSQDKLDFLGYTWGRYYQVVSQAIKRYDPNHLYLGSRLYSSDKDRPEIFRNIGPYVDVISVNHYSQWTPDISRIRMWERESGRPVIISEWYVKGEDSGMANNTGAGWVVHTQADRGRFYENFALALLESKVVVGWHWFKYADNDPDDTSADPSNIDSNKGVVSNRYDPYYELLDAAKRINERAYRLTDYFDGRNLH